MKNVRASIFSGAMFFTCSFATHEQAIASHDWDIHPRESITVQTSAGPVSFSARLRGKQAILTARAQGKTLLVRRWTACPVGHRSVHLRRYRIRGVREPLVLFTLDGPAADGAWVVVSLYVVRANRVREAVNTNGIQRLEDGLCIGNLTPQGQSGIAVGEHIQGDEGVVGSHRYRATLYTRIGKVLKQTEIRETERAYDSFEQAQPELRLRCQDRLAPILAGE